MGSAYLRQRRYREAAHYFDSVLSSEANNVAAHKGRADCLLGLGEHHEALDHFQLLQQLTPDDPEVYYFTALALGGLGRRKQALKMFRRAILANPGYLPAWISQAEMLVELEEYTRAVLCCERALQLDPNDPMPWVLKGRALARRGEKGEARACLGHARRLRPYFDPAEQLQQELGELPQLPAPKGADEAVFRAEQLLLDHNPQALRERVERSLERGESDRADHYLLRLMRLDPQDEETARLRFELFLRQARWEAAQSECVFLMDLYERQGRLEDALAVADRLRDHRPDGEKMLLKHVLMFHRLGHEPEVRDWSQKLLDFYQQQEDHQQLKAMRAWLKKHGRL